MYSHVRASLPFLWTLVSWSFPFCPSDNIGKNTYPTLVQVAVVQVASSSPMNTITTITNLISQQTHTRKKLRRKL